MKNFKNIFIIIGIFIILVLLFSVSFFTDNTDNNKEDLLGINYNVKSNSTKLDQYDTSNPVVALYVENYGSIVIELYKDVAVNTVNNFISLVLSGYYDNNTFHRLVKGFVLQGGDKSGTGSGDAGYNISGEFNSNGYNNDLKHKKWIVSMARSSSYDSASSQFFIMLGDASHLDGEYAAFGKVIDGFKNIKRIEEKETVIDSNSGKLKNNLVIKKALVDLKNNEVSDVIKIEK